MMVETRMLGISPATKGLLYIEEMIKGKVTEEGLSDRQIEDVIYSWETRNFVSHEEYEGPGIPLDNIVPDNTRNENMEEGQIRQREYNRLYVKQIAERLKIISYIVNVLGLPLGNLGSHYIEQMLIGRITTEDLKDKELKIILDAWKSRTCDKERRFGPFIDEDKIVSDTTNFLEPGQMKQSEYDRLCVQDIERYLKEKRY